jgi:hypothetical protein
MSADGITRWHSKAEGALIILSLLGGGFAISWIEVARPLPPRDDLLVIGGTVEKMTVRKVDHCTHLRLRIDTVRGHADVGNSVLCSEIAKLAPLPPGAPVRVLVEPMAEGHLVWELRSADRVLIPYRQMRSARESQQRIAGGMRYAIAALCLPLVVILAVYLWKELSRAASSLAQRRR